MAIWNKIFKPNASAEKEGKHVPQPQAGSSSKPSIIIAPAAFHVPAHYGLFQSYMRRLGHECIVPKLVSATNDTSVEDPFDKDVANLHKSIETELNTGRDVILICHSYGGVYGPEAVARLSSSSQPNGSVFDSPPPSADSSINNIINSNPQNRRSPPSGTGRLLGIVFVSATVCYRGQSLISSMSGNRPSWIKPQKSDPRLSNADSPAETFFSCCKDLKWKDRAVKMVTPQLSKVFVAETRGAGWMQYPCFYVKSALDQAMTVQMQDKMIDRLRAGKKGMHGDVRRVEVVELESDHMPFLSAPLRLAAWMTAMSSMLAPQ